MGEKRSSSPVRQAKIWGDTCTSQMKTYKTAAGTLLLRKCCPPSLVERLRADEGLRAFGRLPEREHHLLLGIAQRSDCLLTLAYTFSGEIVGQVTLAPASSWWEGIPNTYEVAVEVSSRWRKLGLAQQLLACAFEMETLERLVIVGMGLSWHWDTEALGLSRFRYRAMIERLFATYGFVEYLTSEPNIHMDPANILLARLGSKVEQGQVNEFFEHLFQSDTLPGL